MTWQQEVENLAGTAEVDQVVAAAMANVTEAGLPETAGEPFWREVYAQAEAELDARGNHATSGPLETVTEVTRPDGTRFVSRNPDLGTVAVLYRPADGYTLRTITGHTVNPLDQEI